MRFVLPCFGLSKHRREPFKSILGMFGDRGVTRGEAGFGSPHTCDAQALAKTGVLGPGAG